MAWRDLPVGGNTEPLGFPHFPTPHQAVVWRNWGMSQPSRPGAVGMKGDGA